MKVQLLPTLLLAAAMFPAGASAAPVTVGPDPAQADAGQARSCPDADYGCTIVQDGLSVPAGKVIKQWRAFFGTEGSVRLVLLERQPDGTLSEIGSSYSEQATPGVGTFAADMVVPDNADAIGVQLYGGSVTSVQVTYDDGPAPDPTPTPEATVVPEETATPSPTPEPDAPPAFTIEGRAVLGSDGRSVDVFTHNDLGKEIDGKIALKVGKKTFASTSISDYDYHSAEDFSLPLTGKPLKQLVKRGRLTATVVAKTTGGTFTQNVKVIRGGAAGFDGTYRGPGPVVIVVSDGVIRNVSQSMNLFCPRSNVFMTRAMGPVPGFPVLVNRDGSFSGRGSRSGDTFHYKGAFTRGGKVTGYLSLFHTQVNLVDGRITAEDCYQAANFTASR